MTAEARKMGRNLSLITINKVIQLMGGALWALIVPRWMGPEHYGQFALAMSLSLLLWWVGDLGGLEVFGRHIPPLLERDPRRARELFGQSFLVRVLIALMLPPFMLVVGPMIAPWLRGWPAALVGMAAGLHIISWTSYHLLYARKEMGKWAMELSWRLMTQLPLVLLAGKYSLTAQMAAFTLNEVIYLAIAIWWTRDWFRWAYLRPKLGALRPYVRMAVGFWATNVGLILLFRTGTLLVQLLTGNSAQVSFYDLALTVFFLVYTIIDQLIRSFLPTVTEFHEGGQQERVGRWLQTLTRWGAALAVVAVIGVQYTADWILPLVLGRAYGEAATVLRVMLLSLPALVLVGVGTVAAAVHQSPRVKLVAIAVGAFTFWASAVYVTPRFGAVGAAWALTLGLNVYALLLFSQVRQALAFPWRKLILLLLLGVPFLFFREMVAEDFWLALGASVLAGAAYLGIGLATKLITMDFLQMVVGLARRR
ncbi:MAG TPA: lipopolysaccharide biosynthesis protein [Anaerolineae bacterium]|nr:lipopolysaccharide biosynthesis protein [Anaerolineae bacterium]